MNKTADFTKRYGIVASLVSVFILFVYLLAVRLGIYLPTGIFWGALIAIITILVYGVLTGTDDTSLLWVFPVSVVTIWLLKTIFVPVGVPFFGSDPYIEQAATFEISQSGWIDLSPWQEGLSKWSNSTNYPLLSILSISLAEPIGLANTAWARWAMPLISLVSLFFIYGISLELYQSKRVALLGSIGFGWTYMYLMFHSLYLRETLAFIFFLGVVYSFIKGRSTSDPRTSTLYRLCSLVFIAGIIITHHFTSLLLVLFGVLMLGVYWARKWLSAKDILEPDNAQWGSATVWIFLLVALLTYWTYLRISPINIIQRLIEDAISGVQVTSFSLPATHRYYIVLINQVITTLAFGVLAVIGVMQKNNRNTLQLTAIVWGSLAGLASLFFAAAGIPGTSSLSSRFELFGYAFLIPAAAFVVVHAYRQRKWLGLALGLIFVLYGLNSVYRFPQYLYSQKQPDFAKREVRLVPLREEYRLIQRINPDAKIASDLVLNRWIRPVTEVSVDNWFRTNPFENQIDREFNFDFLVVGERELFLLSSNYYGQSLEDLGLSKVYSAGQVAIYAPLSNHVEQFQISKIISQTADTIEANVSLDPQVFLLLALEIVLLLALAYLLGIQGGEFSLGNLGTGFAMAVMVVFVLYMCMNLLGYRTPGPFILLGLVVLLVLGLRFSKVKFSLGQKLNQRALILLCLACVCMFGYGFLVDAVAQHRQLDAYTEFYIQSIAPCDGNTCVSLSITNHEGSRMSYQIEGFADQITLDPSASWQGSLVVPQGEVDGLNLNLTKSPKAPSNENLIIQVDHSFQ